MKWRVLIGDKTLTFTSDLAKHKFFEHKGKHAIIEIDDKPSSQMRRFFEGAVVPYVFYQHPAAGWETFRDAREALKAEFLPAYAKSLKGDRVKIARSTASLSKAKFRIFVETVLRWLEENEYEVPDSEDYKRWENSAPGPDEVYAPLQRIIDKYKKTHETP